MGCPTSVRRAEEKCRSPVANTMASVTENYSMFEVHLVVRVLLAETSRRIVSVYGQKEVSVRCKKLKDGRTTPNDNAEKHGHS
jgi:hypothetical protein